MGLPNADRHRKMLLATVQLGMANSRLKVLTPPVQFYLTMDLKVALSWLICTLGRADGALSGGQCGELLFQPRPYDLGPSQCGCSKLKLPYARLMRNRARR